MNIGIPDRCPVCGGELKILTSKDGIKDLFCVNKDCPAKTNEMIAAFCDKLGIMGVSNTTLANWKIQTVRDIIDFKPNPSYKSELKFAAELDKKLWNAPKRTIFIALSAFIYGTGQRVMEAFWDKFGGEDCLKEGWVNTVESKPSMKEDLVLGVLDNLRKLWRLIVEDPRYNAPVEVSVKEEATKGTICFTGKLETMTRSVAQEKAKKLGYKIADGVSKDLGTLVVADAGLQGAPSSKLKKARQLGITIMSESEFNNL